MMRDNLYIMFRLPIFAVLVTMALFVLAPMTVHAEQDMQAAVPVESIEEPMASAEPEAVAEESVEPESMPEHESSTEPEQEDDPLLKLQGLAPWQILQSNALLSEFYAPASEHVEAVNGAIVKIKVLRALHDEMIELAAPMTVVLISSGGFEVRHPMYISSRSMELEYVLPKSNPSLIAIVERCDCDNPYDDITHLFMLYRGSLMRPLGAVSSVADIDGDSMVEPFMYDTSFADGLDFMLPGTGPVIKVFLSYQGGRLVNDTELFAMYYTNRLEALSGQIERSRAESPDSADLSPAIEKLLYYRAMDREAEGWKALEQDIMAYGGNDFPMLMQEGSVELVPVEEIISRARKALGKSWKK